MVKAQGKRVPLNVRISQEARGILETSTRVLGVTQTAVVEMALRLLYIENVWELELKQKERERRKRKGQRSQASR